MKFDTNQAESQYALLSTNLNAFVIQVLSQYEQAVQGLQAQNKTLTEENKRLSDKYEPNKKKENPQPKPQGKEMKQ